MKNSNESCATRANININLNVACAADEMDLVAEKIKNLIDLLS